MTLLALILAFALEQMRPLGRSKRVWLLFVRYTNYIERNFNAGLALHGYFTWLAVVVPSVIIVVAIQLLLANISPILGLFWCVAILYVTMGFRHFSGAFSDMVNALVEGRDFDAREALRKWSGKSTSELSTSEMVSLAIEQGILDSYRHVFGTMFWFAVFGSIGLGSLGAVLYQLSVLLDKKLANRSESSVHSDVFRLCAGRIVYVLDWVPVRITAASFAVMGNFEDAVYCWRAQAHTWRAHAEGVLFAAAAGAIGVKINDRDISFRPELGVGDTAEPEHLKSAVGLIWRSVILWLFIMLLMTIVHLLS